MFNLFGKEIVYESEFIDRGILFSIKLKSITSEKEYEFFNEDSNILEKIYKEYPEITILEEYFIEGIIDKSEEGYLLKYEDIYKLDEEDLKVLDLFEMNKIDIILDNISHIGNEQFKLIYDILIKDIGNLRDLYIRKGNIIEYMGKAYLLSENQYRLITMIDNYIFISREDQIRYFADAKNISETIGASMNDYLKNENYYYPKSFDVDIIKHSDKKLELAPLFKDLDGNINKGLNERKEIDRLNSLGEGKKRNRIIVDDSKIHDFNSVKESSLIEDKEIPKFLENPSSFIPESIDLEEFSKRVKGLKIAKYEAKPSVAVSSENEWYNFDVSFDLDSEEYEESEEDKTIDKNELKDLVKKAIYDKEDYIYFNNSWIKIDRELCENVLEIEKNENMRVNKKNSRYILEIFDNVSKLEYDESYLDLRSNLRGHQVDEYVKPKLLDASLYSYQEEGYNWILDLRNSGLGGLLADDMGLGKTIQIIAYFAYLLERDELGPTLIVLPRALISNWESEIEKFLMGDYNILVYHGSDRIKSKKIIESYDMVITTYDTLVRDEIIMGKIDWEILVLDEAQKIKNASTFYANSTKAMKARHRLALTGTPVENSLSELWSIVDFAQPGLLKSYRDFKRDFENPIENASKNEVLARKKSKELIGILEPIFLRRLKENELEELPSKNIEYIECEFGDWQLEMYEKEFLDIKPNTVQNLLMISSHPRLITKDINVDSETLLKESDKLTQTIKLLKEIRDRGEKVLIYSRFKIMQRILRKVINTELGINSLIINGEVTDDRKSIVDDFSDKEGFNIMILSPKAAGVGLNIVAANNVIHYTREWNPAVENQATDRVYRIGQKKDINVYYPTIVSPKGKTVEEELNNLLNRKTNLAENVIVPMDRIKVSNKELLDAISN